MSAFQDILDEPDEAEAASPTSASEPAVAETPVEATEPTTPAVESRTGEEPAPDGGTNTAATPAPIVREDGASWSEKAQRWYKDGKIVAGEAPAPKVEQAPEALTPAPVAEVPKVEAPAPVVAEPFTFRANGQRHAIPGLVVPPEQQELVRSLLVDGVNHRQNFGRMQAEWKQKLTQAEQMVEAKSGKYNKAAVYLFDKLQTLMAEQPQELEMTRRELALMLKEADLTIPKAPESAQADDGGVDEGAARSTLSGYVRELFEDTQDAAKYFTPEDRKDFEAHVQELIESFFVEHEGEIVMDERKVEAHFKRQLGLLQRAHQARETVTRDVQKAKAAAAFNAAQTLTPKASPVPTTRKPTPALAAASGKTEKPWSKRVDDIFAERDDEE